jgi:hypothetical protein
MKELKPLPIVMKPMPLSKHIVLGNDKHFEYVLTDINSELAEEISSKYKTNGDLAFIIEKNGFVIDSRDVIMYGKSTDIHDYRSRATLETIVTYNETLTMPHPVDLNKREVGNLIASGVPAYRFCEYAVGLIGNPDNIIIFKNDRFRTSKS